MSGIAVGMVAGYLAALYLGMVDFSVLRGLPPVTVPQPFKYGFDFRPVPFLVAALVYLLSIFEAVGDLTATAMVSGEDYEGADFRNGCAAAFWPTGWCRSSPPRWARCP